MILLLTMVLPQYLHYSLSASTHFTSSSTRLTPVHLPQHSALTLLSWTNLGKHIPSHPALYSSRVSQFILLNYRRWSQRWINGNHRHWANGWLKPYGDGPKQPYYGFWLSVYVGAFGLISVVLSIVQIYGQFKPPTPAATNGWVKCVEFSLFATWWFLMCGEIVPCDEWEFGWFAVIYITPWQEMLNRNDLSTEPTGGGASYPLGIVDKVLLCNNFQTTIPRCIDASFRRGIVVRDGDRWTSLKASLIPTWHYRQDRERVE